MRKRDKSVYKRKEFGHWEIDTVVSGLGKSKACFVTPAERKTRYYSVLRMAKSVALNIICYVKNALKQAQESVFPYKLHTWFLPSDQDNGLKHLTNVKFASKI